MEFICVLTAMDWGPVVFQGLPLLGAEIAEVSETEPLPYGVTLQWGVRQPVNRSCSSRWLKLVVVVGEQYGQSWRGGKALRGFPLCNMGSPESFSTDFVILRVLWKDHWHPYGEFSKNNNHRSQHFLSTYSVPGALKCVYISTNLTHKNPMRLCISFLLLL